MAIKSCGLTSWQVAGLRSGIAAAALLAFLPAARRGWDRMVLLGGCAYAATMILFVLANRLTTAANTTFLQSTAPLYVLLLAPWLLREHTGRRELVVMAVLAAGLCLFFIDIDEPVATAPAPFRGNLLAGLAGISWGLTLIALRRAGSRGSGLPSVVAGNVIAFLVAMPMALPLEGGVSAVDWAILAYLGVIQIGLAYVFLTRGLRGISAFEGALLLLVEPALNPLWASWVHGERPGPWSITGGALILLATAVNAWVARAKRA